MGCVDAVLLETSIIRTCLSCSTIAPATQQKDAAAATTCFTKKNSGLAYVICLSRNEGSLGF